MWLRVVEVWLVTRLLASPTFHRAVRRVHKKVHEIKSGEKLYHPEEFSNLDINKPKAGDAKQFLKHFGDELKDQFRGTTKPDLRSNATRPTGHDAKPSGQFFRDFVEELKDQFRGTTKK